LRSSWPAPGSAGHSAGFPVERVVSPASVVVSAQPVLLEAEVAVLPGASPALAKRAVVQA